MKFSELKGRAVISLGGAMKIGEVADLMIEPESHHIVSIEVRTDMSYAAQIVPVANVKNMGSDAVTLSTGGMTQSTAEQRITSSQHNDTGGTTSAAVMISVGSMSLHPLIEITSLLGGRVVTDAGTMIGQVSDIMLDWVDLRITGYEICLGGLFNKAQEFADTPGVHYGSRLITVPAELLNHPK